ncbi:hypothetical protein G6F24_015803 [Rhizopus arrhizus]|nr:hypothetical protein G6F24_015803 [Rhizopus arrhizus]
MPALQAGPSSHATGGGRCHDRGLPSREPVLVKTRLAVALLIALSAPAVALAAPPATAAPASVATESPADAAFRAVYEKEWKWRQDGGVAAGGLRRRAAAGPVAAAQDACPEKARGQFGPQRRRQSGHRADGHRGSLV